jgi:hypothetical protein
MLTHSIARSQLLMATTKNLRTLPRPRPPRRRLPSPTRPSHERMRFSDVPQQQKAFLVVSSRTGDTHLDKMSTQPSCVGHLYNNSSPSSIRPACLSVSVFNCTARPAFCFRFSDLICPLRLDARFAPIRSPASHPACAHWDWRKEGTGKIFESRATNGFLLSALLILFPKCSRLWFLPCALLGSKLDFSRAFRP